MLVIARRTGGEQKRYSAEKAAEWYVWFHPANLKNSPAVWVVIAATSSSEMPRAAAIVSATMRVCAGSQRFPRNGTGARYGQSVSTMNFQSGTFAATPRAS